ncbi:hypothetical protein HG536_0B00160 [Torulaspora globosa]|uniref:Peptidase A2B Ty3 transposon peptidase domain-containing protein n=1 Tax=Torulaspora globosa TaxID=48254 RepID=A0A7G3ZCC1_9SACH|nr:uncharacterized protein HG536_0B00160 [Torulaspora globosa]QLL31157.1 hypothetical protein HG536_0B00160 [Torulaspora globosa]
MKTLFDSGSPTSFIRSDMVKLLNLRTYETPPFRFRGFIPTDASTTTEAVSLTVPVEDLQIPVVAYILENMDYQLLIANPILRRYPKLLSIILESTPNLKACENRVKVSYLEPESTGNCGNSRRPEMSLATTTLEAIDRKSIGHRGKAKCASPVTTTSETASALDNPGYPGDPELIVQELEQIRLPEEAAFLEEMGEKSLVASVRGLAPVVVREQRLKDTVDVLPPWLQQKYGKIRNDLPPRFSSSDEAPVKHDIEIKKNARLPRLQPYQTTQKTEQEINKLVPSKSPCTSLLPSLSTKKMDHFDSVLITES